MKYEKVIEGCFVSRPNRFCAIVNINGKDEICHVKNTGRCKELLVKGCRVFLEESSNPQRKTKYSLVSVIKNGRCINIDSIAPNKAVYEWLKKGGLIKNPTLIKSECTYESSRFDFYIEKDERKIFAEVKGVTLENDGVVMFPDAPTLRGVKHLNELIKCKKQGYEAYVIFVVQMRDVKYFTPNAQTHKEFADTLKKCRDEGVNIICVDCEVTPSSMEIKSNVDIVL